MHILVTGGAGFIGSNQARYFLDRGFDISVLDDFSTGTLGNLNNIKDKIKIFRGSIGDKEVVRQALKDVDVILHNAAFLGVVNVVENPWKVFQVNAHDNHIFFEQVLNSPAKKLIFASSSEVYGEPLELSDKKRTGETDYIDYRVTAYGIAKKLAESACKVMYENYGIDTCSFRYFNAYGPYQLSSPYGFVAGIFLRNALENKPLTIFGDGHQTRAFTYVQDVCDANLLAINTKTKGDYFNIGTERETTMLELANLVKKISGKNIPILHEAARDYDSRRRCGDSEKARHLLGWTPRVELEEGLTKTWEWMQNNSKA